MHKEEIIQKSPSQNDPDIITARGTFRQAKALFKFLLSKWWILAVFGLLGAAIGFYIAYSSKPTYTATLDFVLSTGTKGSSYSGLASQFGIDIGGQSNNDVFSGDNIITLFKSKRMIKTVLFKKTPESNESILNMIVKDLEWNKSWGKNERTKNLYPFPDDTSKLTRIQDSLIRVVHNHILKNQLIISRSDPKLSIYSINMTSTNEVVACYFSRYLMEETARFYIDTKTSSARETLNLLRRESDSLRGLLSGSIVTSAAAADRTFALNPAMQVQRAPVEKGQVRTTVLAALYGEVVKNLQLAKITLSKENPLYQVIDVPELPLDIKKVSKKFATLTGFFIGVFLIAIVLILIRFIKFIND